MIAAFREDPSPDLYGFLVVCNFDTTGSQNIRIDLSEHIRDEGPFYYTDLLINKTETIREPILDLQLAACATQVLKFPKF